MVQHTQTGNGKMYLLLLLLPNVPVFREKQPDVLQDSWITQGAREGLFREDFMDMSAYRSQQFLLTAALVSDL